MNSLFAFRFELSRKASTHDVLMIFVATPELDAEALATVVEAEIEANLVPDELLLIVREPSFAGTQTQLSENSQNEATLARLRGRASVTLLGYDELGGEASRAAIAGPPPRRVVKFEDIRRRAVTSIFNSRRGFVESTPTYHFENPSGRHTERFIRLSNILVRGAEIAFIGFCTLPFIPTNTTIAYLDTPSLYAVVAAINAQRASFLGAGSILADNFSSYAGVGSYQFTQIEEAVVLISASSSGTLASDLMRGQHFASDRITHLLFLGEDKSGSNIVCDLRRDADRNEDGVANLPAVETVPECRLCSAGSHAIKLQGDQFEFAGPQQDSLLIAKADAPQTLAKLMERTAGGNIYGVGLQRAAGRHPRLFNIDPAAMLAHPPFLRRLDYVLRRSIPSSMQHVIAIDDDSIALAKKIADFSGKRVALIQRDQIDTIPRETTSAIVVAAAVIESGRSLLDVSRDLRSIAPEAPIQYLVGLSKSTGAPRRDALDRTLTQTVNPFPYNVTEVERMILPLSSEASAWASELTLLVDPDVQALVPAGARDLLAQRLLRLRKASQALSDDLFLSNAADRKLRLQPGFVFWPDGVPERDHSQADVFFTVASVLQQLRSNAHRAAKSAIRSNWFQQTILAPENFGRFNDDIIQASILRAAYPYEMNFADAPADSREIGRLVRRIILAAGTDRGGAAAEFLLALATRRLQLRHADVATVLESKATASPMIDFLQSVCRARLVPSNPAKSDGN